MTAAAPVLETSGQRDADLALLAKALGHPARVRILRLLLARDACYCASRERLAEAHELLGGLLADAVDVDTRGCD